jgi:hypothetical protein
LCPSVVSEVCARQVAQKLAGERCVAVLFHILLSSAKSLTHCTEFLRFLLCFRPTSLHAGPLVERFTTSSTLAFLRVKLRELRAFVVESWRYIAVINSVMGYRFQCVPLQILLLFFFR